jgi:ribosomal protein L27
MAHKKGGGSSRNGRDSAGSSDDTLFARVSGRVDFDRSQGKSVVSVIEEPVLQEATA